MDKKIKILYNNCYGGFRFSDEFKNEYYKRHGIQINNLGITRYRMDKKSIELFEELGSENSSGKYSKLKIYEYPADKIEFMRIDDDDGWELIYYDNKSAYIKLLNIMIKDERIPKEYRDLYNEI